MRIASMLAAGRVAALLAGLALAAPATATVIGLSATMDCAQANAGAGTCAAGGSGSGTASLVFDDVTNALDWTVSWSGLSGTTTVAHFHGPAGPTMNAGVQVDFLGIAPGNPSVGSTFITAGQGAQLVAGLWYVNIHSTTFPGGEIRGQLTRNVPEPLSALLVVAGAAGLGLARRRTRPARRADR